MDIKERMQAVLQAESEAIAGIRVTDDFERAVKVMQACQGKIITTGIGKAGYIAKKFAATLCSTPRLPTSSTPPKPRMAISAWSDNAM